MQAGACSRMSSTATAGSGRPSTRRGERAAGAGAWMLSGRGVALPSSSSAPQCSARSRGHGRARRSGDRPRACRRRRAPRRPRSARGRSIGANTAERGPTHTRASPARSRRHSLVALARGSRECSTATVSPKRSMKRPTICGVSAISGTSTIAPRPLLERVGRGAQIDLGLARARDAAQQPRLRLPLAASAAHSAPEQAPARRSSSGGSGAARARPDMVGRGRRDRAALAPAQPARGRRAGAPGASARASVEQYSAAIHPARRPRARAGTPSVERAQRARAASPRDLAARRAAPTTTPDQLAAPERHHQHRADVHAGGSPAGRR